MSAFGLGDRNTAGQARRPGNFATTAQNVHSAIALHRQGRLREAEQLYRAVLEVNESDFDCLHNLGLLHAQESRFDDAVGLLRAGARQDPRSVEAHNSLANVLAKLQRHDEAAAGFRIAITLKPDFAEAHHNLGNALAMQGRSDEAVEHHEQALALRPDYADPHVKLGNIRKEQGRLAEAAAHYRKALVIHPGLAEAQFRLGDVLGKQGRISDATACYQRALALEPDRAEAWLGLGNAFEQAQRYHDAIAAYEKASGLAEAWLGRARILKRLSRSQEAVVAYRRALVEGGDSEVIRFFLASLGAEPAPAAAPNRLISTVYDQHAGYYDQHMLRTLKYRIPDLLLDAVVRLLPIHKLDILDLGCGTGLLGARFHPLARTLSGVDISPKMLELARQRQIYDNLTCGELVEFLQAQTKEFDLAVAADVFAYIGDLSGVFREARGALKSGGFFGFSVEVSEGQDFVLRPNLRYAHSAAYLEKLSQEHGFVVEAIDSKVLRRENGDDVAGHIAILRRG
ncbi:MAG TPA: tetratricopeptide repeat protein [Xanthobacteraceae bacterium]